ncbi:hypothetical protein T484DRAFT_3633907 [Baffinella frigidus]|nr:hypothetical protein T484DRAFT_3633907 [Cryptophyta sp. CCMP2293]
MSESARPMRAAVAAAAAISLLVLGLVDLSRPRGDRAGSEVALEESYMYGAPGNRGRAPGVRAIEHSFERFYQKGLHGVDETRVDLPLQHFSVTESGVRLRFRPPCSSQRIRTPHPSHPLLRPAARLKYQR